MCSFFHPDFQGSEHTWWTSPGSYSTGSGQYGALDSQLDPNNVPVFYPPLIRNNRMGLCNGVAAGTNQSCYNAGKFYFDEWYRDTPGMLNGPVSTLRDVHKLTIS
jgi:hypothetical protein